MYLPINYINSEEEMTHYSVAQLFKMITLRMVFFFQHLSQSVSSPTLLAVLSWSFFALNPQMESVASRML
jgi:hypothetical protein